MAYGATRPTHPARKDISTLIQARNQHTFLMVRKPPQKFKPSFFLPLYFYFVTVDRVFVVGSKTREKLLCKESSAKPKSGGRQSVISNQALSDPRPAADMI